MSLTKYSIGDNQVGVHPPSSRFQNQYNSETKTDWQSEQTSTMNSNGSLVQEHQGVIIKDIVPRSMQYHGQRVYDDDDDCVCTCACCRSECCPVVSDWCVRDPYGLSCGFTTWFLFIYAQFVMIFVILIPKSHSTLFNLINLILFHGLEILAVSSHVRTMFSNPVRTWSMAIIFNVDFV